MLLIFIIIWLIEKKKIQQNFNSVRRNTIKKDLILLGATKIDYIENIDLKILQKKNTRKKRFKLFVAYYIKNIRLIDNI